jgi:GH24 family phage-related lysozyme (muramidase)
MTFQQWEAEVQKRISINEGYRTTVYMDTANPPNPTVGIGFNLNRGDARAALAKIGANYDAVLHGTALTDQQVTQLFAYSLAPVIDEARASLQPMHFDSMSDARRFVICDLVFNLGNAGWLDFVNTRGLIDQACHAERWGNTAGAHNLFVQAATALTESDWYTEVGDRARRDVAMMRTSNWCDPNGNGSDAS